MSTVLVPLVGWFGCMLKRSSPPRDLSSALTVTVLVPRSKCPCDCGSLQEHAHSDGRVSLIYPTSSSAAWAIYSSSSILYELGSHDRPWLGLRTERVFSGTISGASLSSKLLEAPPHPRLTLAHRRIHPHARLSLTFVPAT